MGSLKSKMNQKPKIYQIHSGKRGWSKKLLQTYGYYTVFNTWYEKGTYRTAKEFGVTPWVINYIAIREGWRRPEWLAPSISKGVQRGRMKAENYKTIRFTNRTEQEFLNLVRVKGKNHSFTHIRNVYFYVEEADRARKWNAQTMKNLALMMKSKPGYEERHIWKLRYTFDLFLAGIIN